MYSNGHSSSRSGSHYYPASSGARYSGPRFDADDLSDQMEYLPSRYGHERSHRFRNQSVSSGTNEGRSPDTSSSRHRASGRTADSSGHRSGYVTSRSSADRATVDRAVHHQNHSRLSGSSTSRVSTRASTVYPEDSISIAGRHRHRQSGAETKSRTVVPVGHRGQHASQEYPPSFPSTSSYQQSRSTRSSRTCDSVSTYSYVLPSRSGVPSEAASNVSSSTVTHPFAYDDSGMTHIWHPAPRYQFSEASHRSRRSDAPSPDSRATYGQTRAGTYRSATSSRTPLPPRSIYEYPPPPPTPVLYGRSRRSFSSISSVMEDAAYDSDVEHPFS